MTTTTKNAPRNTNAFYETLLRHPHEVGESYGQHLGFTLNVAGYLLLTAAIIVIHGLVPSLFDHTGSTRIAKLHARFTNRGQSAE